jgi:alpha-L-fucosidase
MPHTLFRPVSFTLSLGTFFLTAAGTVASAEEPPRTPPVQAARVPKTELGIAQLPNEKLDWFLDAKFGMFIHWGLYSGPGRGEWVMEHEAISPGKYRAYAYPESGDAYFDAAGYRPQAWAQLAKDAGMKWLCLTARHHDGFSLFDSPHPNAFTSMQTLGRDLLAEYVEACRAAGLKVGIYYSPLSWRYPGYYDVTGTNCLPNKFGYKTDSAHLENARLMKEENYVNVKKLLTGYGKIDHIFWDGGWLAQKGSDADAAFFHEPGKYLDPANRWPIPAQYHDLEDGTGKALGIMGMVRKYQPDAITNLRYGWIGDIHEEEGPRETSGGIRSQEIYNKCLTIQNGGWGYNAKSIAEGNVMTLDQLVRYMANCVVRNMTFLLNVTPDRHGVIPDIEQQRLREMGAWMTRMGDAIYGTRGGPWEPVDGQYGFCYKGSTVFVHLLSDYAGTTFRLPPLGKLRVKKVYEVYTGKTLLFDGESDVVAHDIDRTSSPADSVIAAVYDDEVRRVWEN